MGYAIEPIHDLAAPLGGYRMRLVQDGAVIDDRIVRITERDETARRLSLFADYLSVAEGMQVYATYHAQETETGTRYALDCHANSPLEVPDSGAPRGLGAALAAMKVEIDADLTEYLRTIKSRIEACPAE